MDKFEYKIRSEEIKSLIAKGEYMEAAAVADTIDWSRVKSVMMLCTISDLYKACRRLEDSRDMLLLAYDRHPGGRSILYSLCELSVKMEEFVQAVEYYKEFVQVAPKDSGRYILQYKLYEAQEVSLEERISVLEELKSRDYTEKWAYELAYLYHRVGLGTRCVEECDELILWFGEGKYVIKALELKMLHEPLTYEQQQKYNKAKQPPAGDGYFAADAYYEEAIQPAEETFYSPAAEIPDKEMDIKVKLMGVGQYDTINMQKELAENMKELWEGPAPEEEDDSQQAGWATISGLDEVTKSIVAPLLEPEPDTWDSSDYGEQVAEGIQGEVKTEEVFFGETGEMDSTASQIMEQLRAENAQGSNAARVEPDAGIRELYASSEIVRDLKETELSAAEDKKYEKMLGMEYDGQISLLLPESEQIEKQITGQIKLDDILIEWEKIKKDSEQKRREAVRQRVMEQTGAMFTEFEASVRDGLLEKLESAKAAANKELTYIGTDAAEAAEEEIQELYEDTEEEVSEVSENELFAEEEQPEVITEEELYSEDGIGEELTEEEQFSDEELPEVYEEEENGYENVQEFAVMTETEQAHSQLQADYQEEIPPEEYDKGKARTLAPEEKELFGSYIQTKNAREQILYAIDNISMASYTGNIILTGDEGMDTLTLAKNLIKQVQVTDSNFSGKIAKISGDILNKKDIDNTLEKLANGALIIQKASGIKKDTAEKVYRALQQENLGMVVVLEDSPKAMNKFLKENHILTETFNIRVDIEALDNDSLVRFGRKYAKDLEYSIDELGVLALHTRIADMQTSDHAVTISEVKDIMEEAIHHANRKNITHFFDILLSKRYDSEDMIILKEKDFI